MIDALDVCETVADAEGWTDSTLIRVLTDFINSEKLGDALLSYLKSRQENDNLPD